MPEEIALVLLMGKMPLPCPALLRCGEPQLRCEEPQLRCGGRQQPLTLQTFLSGAFGQFPQGVEMPPSGPIP